jgi:hypothetical protein
LRSSICDRTDDTLDRSNTNKIWLSRKTHRDLYVCMANFAMEPREVSVESLLLAAAVAASPSRSWRQRIDLFPTPRKYAKRPQPAIRSDRRPLGKLRCKAICAPAIGFVDGVISCYLANLCRLLGLPEFFGF